MNSNSNSFIDELKKKADVEAKKKYNLLKGHSFRLICNALLKLVAEGENNYKSNKYEHAYVNYMTVINIFSDILPTLKDFERSLPEYKILGNELNSAIETITTIKENLQNREKALKEQNSYVSNSLDNFSASRSSLNEQISSPRSGNKKTIDSEKIYKYILRILKEEEIRPPQILLIDIRKPSDYESNHITWRNNKYDYNGVINIPLESFYGLNVDINRILYEAESKEFNERRKKLIRNIFESDLIIYYDDQSSTVNNQVYQLISDVLYHNNNGKNIKRPPVMLENGYQGWVQFIRKSGYNISEFIEGSGVNNSVEFATRKLDTMSIGNQNINNISKDKVNNYSNESLTNSYYMQYANMGSNLMTPMPPSQPQPMSASMNMPSAPLINTNYPSTPGQMNDLYSNINVLPPSASPAAIQNPAYPNLEESLKNSIPQPTLNNQPVIPPKPLALSYPPISPLPVQQPGANYNPPMPSAPTQQQYYPTAPTNVAPLQPVKPPEIPERHNSNKPSSSTTKLSNAASYDSLSTYKNLQSPSINKKNVGTGDPPVVPPRPANEFALNEIHNKNHGTVGLRNLGNTCYMNSILQCLNATSLLTRFFRDGRFRNDINTDNTLGTKGRLANEYYKFLYTVWNEHQPVISPTNIKDVVSNFNTEFKGTEQHDSQEFLSCILDGLHEDLNVARRKSKPEIESIRKRHDQETRKEEREDLPLDVLQDNAWKRYLDFNYSIIVTTFQGQYMSTLKCLECKKSSSTFNSLMYLSVPIPENATSLYNCLDKYIEIEYLRGNDAWSCPRCKKKVNASKQLILSRLPRVMLIHLKRFYFQGPFKDKITKLISFPLKNLDLSKYTHPFRINENKYKYNLFAISNHYGTLSGGHYTAYIKDKISNNWVSFDDSRISDISESKLITNAAYILFYERVES